tara:strand:+ start:1868 stop:2053 length:186 start_codon:yes stop_codon:yes gene_type:complete
MDKDEFERRRAIAEVRAVVAAAQKNKQPTALEGSSTTPNIKNPKPIVIHNLMQLYFNKLKK